MHCWPRYFLWTIIAVLGAGNMITACGQKGDLYLPDEAHEEQVERTPLPAQEGTAPQ